MARKLCVLFWLVMLPSIASATPIRVYAGAENPGSPYVTIHAPGALADGLQVMVGSVGFSGDLGTFDAYCVDINHYLTPDRWYAVDSVDSMSAWGTADPSLKTVNSPSDAGRRVAYLVDTFGNASDSLRRWALQTAIWNALYDSDSDITSGAFWVSTSYTAGVSTANAMLQALALYDGAPMDARWLRLANDASHGTQDFTTPVPEAASLLLVGSGMLMLLVRRQAARRRRRTAHGPHAIR